MPTSRCSDDRRARVLPRRDFLATMAASAAAATLPGCSPGARRPPNVVIVFLDDAGWADFPPFGAPDYAMPNITRLADEGCRYTQFYVPQAVCSASRAALLSGCYPGRTKVFGAHGPGARGLEPSYATLAEVLKPQGYATAVFGKWHIGDQPETRPPARGFDESSGLMYSNDMWEHHPEAPEYWGRVPLQFWRNGEVAVERVTPEHQAMLTTWYTEHAVDFIGRRADHPFFLYVPHAMPHVPLFVSERFAGRSGQGLYADVMMEIDWSVGEIIRALADHGVADDTVVLLTSDNGPWISYGNHAGVTPYREAKGTTFDGGTRSPCVVRYPRAIDAGAVSHDAWCTIDVLPTVAALAGAALPANAIDGRNVWPLVTGAPGATNPHDYYAFSNNAQFEAIMSGDGRWKLHFSHNYRTLVEAGDDGMPGAYRQETVARSLYDLRNDPYETTDVLAEHPDVVARLDAHAERHRQQFYETA